MIRKLKNLLSYVWFIFSLDYFQLVSTLIDIFILVYAYVNREEVLSQPTFLLLSIAVLVNFIWQIVNVMSHFTFLKEEEPEKPLKSMLDDGKGGKNFDLIMLDSNLFNYEMPYRKSEEEEGVLINDTVNAVLTNPACKITTNIVETKRSNTKTYILQYESILLKFLNHRWHDINRRKGVFTNDKKICLGSELVLENDGTYHWSICEGRYYNGYLTNFIYSQYVGGSYYKLYPPLNASNTPIKTFGSSDFSDHIGVSTLLLTDDDFIVVFEQADNAGYNEGKLMPSGSGSLDYSDFKKGEDFRQMIVRGAERELMQEASFEKKLKDKNWNAHLETHILSFYRDLERGGKPEFCCLTRINKKKESIVNDVIANVTELARRSDKWVKIDDTNKWNQILSEASLSLKMNYHSLIKRK